MRRVAPAGVAAAEAAAGLTWVGEVVAGPPGVEWRGAAGAGRWRGFEHWRRAAGAEAGAGSSSEPARARAHTGRADTSRAKTTIRSAALNSGWHAVRTSRSYDTRRVTQVAVGATMRVRSTR